MKKDTWERSVFSADCDKVVGGRVWSLRQAGWRQRGGRMKLLGPHAPREEDNWPGALQPDLEKSGWRAVLGRPGKQGIAIGAGDAAWRRGAW